MKSFPIDFCLIIVTFAFVKSCRCNVSTIQ